METDDDLYLEWENDDAFTNFTDLSSLNSLDDTYGTNLNDRVPFKEQLRHGETDGDLDYALAVSLQMQLDNELKENKNNNSEKSGASKPLSIIDKQWELIDPVPDIHALFIEFDAKFFYGKLKCVEVRWSSRMTLCAGICSYQGRGGLCSIALSVPLLKLRPRSDLVETLLHEMIHAYLFVTHNNKDRDGHGPEFLSHMHRINKEAGTRITVYHSFHDEVKLYKQHWWKCDGPCNKRPPFYGYVKRAMNRAPGPNDNWWASHQSTCGGKFVKVKEPENYGEKKKRKLQSDSKTPQSLSDIRKFAKVVGSTSSSGSASSSEESKTKLMDSISPVFSPKKSVPPNKDKSVETPKKKNFVPFLGAGRKLGSSSETIQTYFSPTSTNATKLHPENNVLKIPASSSVKGSSVQSRLVKNFKTQSPSKVGPKGHSINTANTSQKPCFQSRKITDSFKTSSERAGALKNDATESLVPQRNLSDSHHSLQKNIATHSDVRDNNVTSMYCPVCSKLVKEEINSHLDKCLKNQN